jgi:hypothetical protein
MANEYYAMIFENPRYLDTLLEEMSVKKGDKKFEDVRSKADDFLYY